MEMFDIITENKLYSMIGHIMIHTLTSFRFIASFLIVLLHMNMYHTYGGLSVTFFFVLSGFILTYNYKEQFKQIRKKELVSFYVSRFSRIYPVHILTFILIVLFPIAVNYPLTLSSALTNLFLLQTYFPTKEVFFFNGVSWSISVEMFFYALFPFIISLLLKLKLKLVLALGVLFYLIVIGVTIAINPPIPTFSVGWWIYYAFPPMQFLSFFVGILFGLVFLKLNNKTHRHFWLFTFLECMSVGLFMFMHSIVVFLPFGPAFQMSLYHLPFIGLIVFVFAFQGGLVSKMLSFKPLVHLGEISYSTYMIHTVIIYYISVFFLPTITATYNGIYHSWAQWTLIIIMLCLSDIMYRYLEMPMRKWIKQVYKVLATKKVEKQQPGINVKYKISVNK